MRKVVLVLSVCGLASCGGPSAGDGDPSGDAAPGVRVGTGSPALDFGDAGGAGAGGGSPGGSAGAAGGNGAGGAGSTLDASPSADGPVGPDLSGADASPPPLDPEAWRGPCDRFAQFFCRRFGECAPLFLASEYGEEGLCRERTASLCRMAALAPGATLVPDQVARCSEEHIGRVSCGDLLTNGSLDMCIPGGSHPNGATCYVGTQCESGLCLLGAKGCGLCTRRAGAGERCLVDGHCRAGLVCPGATLTCTRPAALGEACLEPGQPCRLPLRCVGGTCVMPRAEGEACLVHEACNVLEQLLCSEDPIARIGRCTRFELPRAGDSCDGTRGQIPVCLAGTCGAAARVCLARARDGEACGPAAGGRACFEPAGCFDGICRLPACAGMP